MLFATPSFAGMTVVVCGVGMGFNAFVHWHFITVAILAMSAVAHADLASDLRCMPVTEALSAAVCSKLSRVVAFADTRPLKPCDERLRGEGIILFLFLPIFL